jgi:predicted dehydrogenase
VISAESLCAVRELDAVFVLNSDEYHTAATLAALRNRKHVLLEKPMCLTLADADAIIRARDEAGTKVMVGYMRRYAPAFTRAVELVRKMGPIRYARPESDRTERLFHRPVEPRLPPGGHPAGSAGGAEAARGAAGRRSARRRPGRSGQRVPAAERAEQP